jgi:hypothetical protein
MNMNMNMNMRSMDLAAVTAVAKTYQRAVVDHLTALTTVLLRASNVRTVHGDVCEAQVVARAGAQVQEELEAIVGKLTQVTSNTLCHTQRRYYIVVILSA